MATDEFPKFAGILSAALSQHHLSEKEMQEAKWLSEEALQIAERRKEVKGKGEKERYTHSNVEFQRIAKRNKKAFLSDQCKEIDENKRMGKTRGLFKNFPQFVVIHTVKGLGIVNKADVFSGTLLLFL